MSKLNEGATPEKCQQLNDNLHSGGLCCEGCKKTMSRPQEAERYYKAVYRINGNRYVQFTWAGLYQGIPPYQKQVLLCKSCEGWVRFAGKWNRDNEVL